MKKTELKDFLDQKYHQYASPAFIATDPIQLPHSFSKKEDIEIAGFLVATIAWGQRATIIKNGERLVQLMDMAPHEFLLGFGSNDEERFASFCHRTFNATDAKGFLKALKDIYRNEGLEKAFGRGGNTFERICRFRERFFAVPHEKRTEKHVSNPAAKSSAKRINMFLRWMARPSAEGVDFGLWQGIRPSELMLPLDVHTGNVARKLGLLKRRQDDWAAVEEITAVLREFDPEDPVKYDFALFGLGAFEKF